MRLFLQALCTGVHVCLQGEVGTGLRSQGEVPVEAESVQIQKRR